MPEGGAQLRFLLFQRIRTMTGTPAILQDCHVLLDNPATLHLTVRQFDLLVVLRTFEIHQQLRARLLLRFGVDWHRYYRHGHDENGLACQGERQYRGVALRSLYVPDLS